MKNKLLNYLLHLLDTQIMKNLLARMTLSYDARTTRMGNFNKLQTTFYSNTSSQQAAQTQFKVSLYEQYQRKEKNRPQAWSDIPELETSTANNKHQIYFKHTEKILIKMKKFNMKSKKQDKTCKQIIAEWQANKTVTARW